MRAAIALALGASACGLGGGPACEAPTTVLAGEGATALTCADADEVATYIEVLAGREISDGDRRLVARGLVERWGADAAGTRAALDALRTTDQGLHALTGLPAAEARSAEVYSVLTGQGYVGSIDDDVKAVFDRAVAVWGRHDGDRLALTEVDVEGWIYYASLCREAQSAEPLRLSVADRVVIYRDVVTRFEGTDRAGRVAMTSLGAFWPSIKEAWSLADFEEQHAWIAKAPLPPPMVATSKGYFSALLDGDVEAHARALHESLGPFRLAVFR